MGGPGSGSLPGNDWSRPGRKKRSAVAVAGTGTPQKPEGLPDAVSAAWDRLCELTAGVTFSQDSSAILMAARLIVRQDAIAEKLDLAPADIGLNRTSLAIGRALLILLGKLGLTPRDRQVLIVPRDEVIPEGRLETLLRRRDEWERNRQSGGVPNRVQDLGRQNEE